MSEDQQPVVPGREERYEQQAVETMPWFYPELDDDLKQALDQLGLQSGRALDLGAGPGTQAMQLAQRGFDVTATDISAAAVHLARQRAEAQGLAVRWQQDDILSTRLSGPFDLIFDGAASTCCHPSGGRTMTVQLLACSSQAAISS
jgi:2-polyprenyl-3-methyl-5-hydroxy-6-metoxy-1,4-benzoquinol methylase